MTFLRSEFGKNKLVYIMYCKNICDLSLYLKGFLNMEDWVGCKISMKKDCIYSKKERFLSEFEKYYVNQ